MGFFYVEVFLRFLKITLAQALSTTGRSGEDSRMLGARSTMLGACYAMSGFASTF